MEISNTLLERIKSDGWTEVENIKSDSDLLVIAQMLGTTIPHPNGQTIFHLVPKNIGEGINGTFSNKYGLGSFPLHTDTAFWPNPVRYILLSSSSISTCQTTITTLTSLLHQLSTNDIKLAERAIFKVKTNNTQFYTSLFFKNRNVQAIKFDNSCMFPANNFAKSFIQLLTEINIDVYKINWTGNKAVIIDNWKCLHGRSDAQMNEKRVLKRIYIN